MKNLPFPHLGLPLSGVLLFIIALTGGCATAGTEPPARLTSTPVRTEDPKFQAELRQLDVFLDANANPSLEKELRRNLARLNDTAFLQAFPEWTQLTLDRPALPDALKAEQLFFLHRALARMTGNLPLEARHLQRLDDFLSANPAIQDALVDDPSLLTSMDFLIQHPPLAAFFERHPDLYTVFCENAALRDALSAPPAE
jgi:hypothetical protein